jgi:adhesin/invasin
LTIVVKDGGGNPLTGLASSAFVLSLTGISTGTFSSVTPTATPGTYTATFTSAIAGTASTLMLKVNGVAISASPKIQVTPGVVGPVKSTVKVATASVASGSTDLVTIAVKDVNNNAVSGLSRSDFVFNFSGGTSTATFASLIETSTPGTYTVLLAGVLAGTASTLTVRVDGVLLSNQPKVTVKAGAVSGAKSAFHLASPTVAPSKTDALTITLKDAAGNAVSGLLNSSFRFTLSDGTSTGTFGTVTATSTPGVYTVAFKGGAAGSASELSVEADDITIETDPTIQVT